MASHNSKKNGAATDGAAEPATDIIPFDAAVAEGQEIVMEIAAAENKGQFRLGELADRLEPKYGDRTLAKFAAEIGLAKCTVDRYRTVYRAWKDKLAPGPNLVSYAVLRELAKHHDREQIIAKHPDLTKREALDLMRKHDGKAKEAKEADQEDNWLKHNKKWFKDLVVLAHDAIRMAAVVDECPPEKLDNLLKAVDPRSLVYVRGGGKRLFDLANKLAELLGEEVQPFPREPIARDRRAEANDATRGAVQ